MDPELKKQLLEMLQHLLSSIEKGATFVTDQIPPLVQEKIALGRIEETLWISVYLISLFAIPLFLVNSVKHFQLATKAELNSSEETRGIVFGLANAAGVVICFFNAIQLFFNMHNFLLVWFAPRIYIVEWLKEMVK